MKYITNLISFLKGLDYKQLVADVFTFGIYGALQTQKRILERCKDPNSK
jgi:hypothetical protein